MFFNKHSSLLCSQGGWVVQILGRAHMFHMTSDFYSFHDGHCWSLSLFVAFCSFPFSTRGFSFLATAHLPPFPTSSEHCHSNTGQLIFMLPVGYCSDQQHRRNNAETACVSFRVTRSQNPSLVLSVRTIVLSFVLFYKPNHSNYCLRLLQFHAISLSKWLLVHISAVHNKGRFLCPDPVSTIFTFIEQLFSQFPFWRNLLYEAPCTQCKARMCVFKRGIVFHLCVNKP